MLLRTAVAIIYNPKGKFLIQDRRTISKWGEDYGFFGGKIEEGETPEEAIVREINEELTFNLSDFDFFKKQSEIDLGIKDPNFKVERSSYIFEMPSLDSLIVKEGKPKIITIDDLQNLKMIKSQPELLIEAYNYLIEQGKINYNRNL